MCASVVGMMIPNAPANVGSFWIAMLLPLEIYGIHARDLQVQAFVLAVWSMHLIQYTIFAGYFVVTGKVSLGGVVEATRQR
jgi:hypothetical protein